MIIQTIVERKIKLPKLIKGEEGTYINQVRAILLNNIVNLKELGDSGVQLKTDNGTYKIGTVISLPYMIKNFKDVNDLSKGIKFHDNRYDHDKKQYMSKIITKNRFLNCF